MAVASGIAEKPGIMSDDVEVIDLEAEEEKKAPDAEAEGAAAEGAEAEGAAAEAEGGAAEESKEGGGAGIKRTQSKVGQSITDEEMQVALVMAGVIRGLLLKTIMNGEAKNIRHLFDAIGDENGDGVVEPDEFQHLVECCQKWDPSLEVDVDLTFRYIDRDNDGFLTFEEFEAFMEGGRSDDTKELQEMKKAAGPAKGAAAKRQPTKVDFGPGVYVPPTPEELEMNRSSGGPPPRHWIPEEELKKTAKKVVFHTQPLGFDIEQRGDNKMPRVKCIHVLKTDGGTRRKSMNHACLVFRPGDYVQSVDGVMMNTLSEAAQTEQLQHPPPLTIEFKTSMWNLCCPTPHPADPKYDMGVYRDQMSRSIPFGADIDEDPVKRERRRTELYEQASKIQEEQQKAAMDAL